ncbi:MAG: Rnase Y domain-containing protein, partial [Desulfobacteraceae bacterium]
MNEYMLGLALVGLAVGFGLAFWLKGYLDSQKAKAAQSHAERILQDARHNADALLKEANLEAKDRLIKMKNEFDLETKETRSELKRQERRLIQKEENL